MKKNKKLMDMLLVVAVIFLVLWALGLITSYTLGGGIHGLLAIAIIVIVGWFVYDRL